MEKNATIILVAIALFGGLIIAWIFSYGGDIDRISLKGQSDNEVIMEEEKLNSNIELPKEELAETSQSNEQIMSDEKVEEKMEELSSDKDNVKSNGLKIKDKFVSWGYTASSGRNIDTIVLHSSFNSLGGEQYDVDAIVDIYKQYGVSAHYIIGRGGTVYRLVKENDISYHAGVSSVPDGRTNVNNFSIGIEIVGNYDDGYTKDQYGAVNDLIDDIKDRYDIKYVLGHDDIAPGRKTDPWNFDWNEIK